MVDPRLQSGYVQQQQETDGAANAPVGVMGRVPDGCGGPTSTRSTAGIAPAIGGALGVLQFSDPRPVEEALSSAYDAGREGGRRISDAAREVASFHSPTEKQRIAHGAMSNALAAFLTELVRCCPPGPERSTAISRAREAKMWASAGIALEGL